MSFKAVLLFYERANTLESTKEKTGEWLGYKDSGDEPICYTIPTRLWLNGHSQRFCKPHIYSPLYVS